MAKFRNAFGTNSFLSGVRRASKIPGGGDEHLQSRMHACTQSQKSGKSGMKCAVFSVSVIRVVSLVCRTQMIMGKEKDIPRDTQIREMSRKRRLWLIL